MDLFNNSVQSSENSLKKFLSVNDKKGAINFLYRISDHRLEQECLDAGFSLISATHGKRKRIADVANQIIKQ